MKRLYTLIVAATAAMTVSAQTGTAAADMTQVATWGDNLRMRLDSVMQGFEEEHYFTGVSVYDLTADSVLFSHNADKLMRPASTQKVMTAVTALDILGAGHKYETKAYYTGEYIAADSTLNGDIYVKGGFDPIYSYSDLRTLAGHIKGLGIKCIKGRILGDVSMKDTLTMGNGWCWDDVPSAVEAYLSPLTFNRGCASVEIDGGRAVFSVPTSYMTLADSTKARSGRLRLTRNWVDNGNNFTVWGTPTRNAVSHPISVYRPERYFVCTLSDVLKEMGVKFENEHSSDYDIAELTDSVAYLFYTCSRTVEQVLQNMMKESDNFYAESMLYQLAHLKGGKWATWEDGTAMVESVMQKAGIPKKHRKVADGSGVSLYNYVTASAQVRMLRYAYLNNNRIYRHLNPSLPVSGVDGTLERRMRNTPAHGNVRAKTGSLSGVSSLTGYCRASNGNLLAFCIMNNGVYKTAIGRDMQDVICLELVK